MNEAVFTKISTNKDQSMTSNVFTTLSDSESGSEAIDDYGFNKPKPL